MKSFKAFVNEQIIKSGESTLDPEFLEKKTKKDSVVSKKIETGIDKVNKDLEKAEDIKI